MRSEVSSRGRQARWLAAAALASGLLAAGGGCSRGKAAAKASPAPKVGVVEARRMDVPVVATPNGTTRALEEVAIRARVRGFLMERHFDEGSFVKKGQLLLVIEEDQYKVALQSAQAKLAVAEAAVKKAELSKAPEVAAATLALDQAQLVLSQVEERRTRSLLQRSAASREDLDKAEADRKRWEAQVEADKASLEQSKSDYKVNILSATGQVDDARATVNNARLDLGYCRMYAPFAGRIGEAKVKVGNLVGPTSTGGSDPTDLATIEQLDPMGVDILVSSRYLDRATRLIPKGLPVHLTRPGLEGEQEHPYVGHCYFIDNTIDRTTSTFLVKSSFPNPEGTLLPGEYVKLRLVVDHIDNGVVVPEQAVTETQAGTVVYVVDPSNKVVVQKVEAAQTPYEGLRVVTVGLNPGDKVIVEGVQMVRPGLTVDPEAVVMARPARDEAKVKAQAAQSPTEASKGQTAAKPDRAKEEETPSVKPGGPRSAVEASGKARPAPGTTPADAPAPKP